MVFSKSAEDLGDPVHGVVKLLELSGLGDEVVDVEAIIEFTGQAGDLDHGADRRISILAGQEPCTVCRELGHSLPIVERHLERTREETAHKVAQLSQHVSDLMIQDMPALDVSELVADDEEQLFWRQVVDATGVEDEDRPFDSRSESVDTYFVLDVE